MASKKFHIVLIRFSSLGDVLLQSPVMSWLKTILGKDVHITFFTSSEFVSLFDGHPVLDDLHSFDRKNKWDFYTQFKEINKRRKIDLVIDLHDTLRAKILKILFPTIPRITLDKRNISRFLFKTFKVKSFLSPDIYCERQILDLTKIFDKDYNRESLSLALKEQFNLQTSQKDQVTSTSSSFKLLEDTFNFPYICFAPSASSDLKMWPSKSFTQLALIILQKTDFKILLLGSKEDFFIDQLALEINSDRIINLRGKTQLSELPSILRYSHLLIGNDSGLAHLAETQGTPVVSLYGPTSPLLGFTPHIKKSRHISLDHLKCKPCTTTGKGKCLFAEQICMTGIGAEYVWTSIRDQLSI